MSENKCPPGSEYYEKSKKCCPEIDYYEPEEVFPAFWEGNIKRDYGCFDFERAFDKLMPFFQEKLLGHGINGIEDCKDHWDQMMAGVNGDALRDFAIDNPWISISKEELYDAVLGYICERYKETFEDEPVFKELKETYDKMLFPPKEEREKAILMDSVVDAVHHGGSLWEDWADVESLRTEFEEKYTEEGNPMKEICVTRVKEAEGIIAKAEKGDKNACLPREGLRQLVGCLGAHNRESKGMEFGESMKKAWEVVNKHKCPPKEK